MMATAMSRCAINAAEKGIQLPNFDEVRWWRANPLSPTQRVYAIFHWRLLMRSLFYFRDLPRDLRHHLPHPHHLVFLLA